MPIRIELKKIQSSSIFTMEDDRSAFFYKQVCPLMQMLYSGLIILVTGQARIIRKIKKRDGRSL